MVVRRSGILLHITSLPSPHGIGDLGPEAYRFADFLHEAGQSLWQVLPLNPTATVYGNSPYSSFSAFAGNPCSSAWNGWSRRDSWTRPNWEVFLRFQWRQSIMRLQPLTSCIAFKERLPAIGKRGERRTRGSSPIAAQTPGGWMPILFSVALKEHFGGEPWYEWPKELRDREGYAVAAMKERLAESIFREMFFQYMFSRQWNELKSYCNRKSIQVMGDVPIYVSLDSADVWCTPQIFKLDQDKRPIFVSGVPPDYFSETGQRWGNPSMTGMP